MIEGKVSVIIPAHNDEKTVLRAIDSVKNQTYPDIEILVIENGSIDNTFEVLENIVKTVVYDNVKVFISQPGRSIARNKGLLEAEGEFIAFLDADDSLCQTHIEKAIDRLQNDVSLFAYAGLADRISDTKNLGVIHDYIGRSINELAIENFFAISSVVFRNKDIVLFDEKINTNEDWLFWVQNLINRHVFFDNEHIATHIFITGDNTMRDIFSLRETMIYVKAIGKKENPIVKHPQLSLVKNMFAFLSGHVSDDKRLRIIVKKEFPLIYTPINTLFGIPFVGKIVSKKIKKYYSIQKNQYTLGEIND
ncbi:glycosyltransferase family 2 protein [Leuconostoc mesenteroides]|uniref:glycosyltransferase family 2 protein n=1 Tax=Leuconostoc mesenteroides TaxID=1245 RepID=UPI0023621DB5|nr:glycosyltransferase family 2 protein [Leuconostoc mesenteroides]